MASHKDLGRCQRVIISAIIDLLCSGPQVGLGEVGSESVAVEGLRAASVLITRKPRVPCVTTRPIRPHIRNTI